MQGAGPLANGGFRRVPCPLQLYVAFSVAAFAMSSLWAVTRHDQSGWRPDRTSFYLLQRGMIANLRGLCLGCLEGRAQN